MRHGEVAVPGSYAADRPPCILSFVFLVCLSRDLLIALFAVSADPCFQTFSHLFLARLQWALLLKGRLHCQQVFVESIRQYLEGRPAEIGEAVFDKEDDLAVEFVTAAANLRAANYNIPQQSLFVTKVHPTQLLPFAHLLMSMLYKARKGP